MAELIDPFAATQKKELIDPFAATSDMGIGGKPPPPTEQLSPLGTGAAAIGRGTQALGKGALNLVGGAGELGLMMLTGALAQIPKVAAGWGGLARGIATGSDIEAAKTVKGIEGRGEAISYEPKYTEFGKQTGQAISNVFGAPKKIGEYLGEKAQAALQPYTGIEPAAMVGATIASAGEAAPYFIGGKKAGGVAGVEKLTEKAVSKVIPSVAPLESQITSSIKKGILKGVSPPPSVVGKTFKERENYFKKGQTVVEDVIKNKDAIELIDRNGDIAKGVLPKTVQQFAHAIQQMKVKLFNQFDTMAKSATGKGVMVNVDPIVDGLRELTTGESAASLMRTSPETLKYATRMLEQYEEAQKVGGITASAAQKDIATLNIGQQTVKDYNTILKSGVDSDILHNLRKLTDDAITNTEGAGYQEFKNIYGAYRAMEKEVNRKATKVGERTGGPLSEYADVYTGFHAVKGMLVHSPATLVAAATAKAIKEAQRHMKHPDTIVRKMFEDTEKLVQKRPSAPIVPPAAGLAVGAQSIKSLSDSELQAIARGQ